ncbi:hypothetical protein CGCSCA1_v007982 [Colletotrichum siamense]|nr:hypothetical protein CGCSCA1_v007982 [Colletotrichum siamense]
MLVLQRSLDNRNSRMCCVRSPQLTRFARRSLFPSSMTQACPELVPVGIHSSATCRQVHALRYSTKHAVHALN